MIISSISIAEVIERYIRAEFQVADNDPMFTRETHLYDSGFVDSIGYVHLIAFIESTFNITLDEEKLMSEDFTTINGISKVIASALA